jgi:hypothetical protein
MLWLQADGKHHSWFEHIVIVEGGDGIRLDEEFERILDTYLNRPGCKAVASEGKQSVVVVDVISDVSMNLSVCKEKCDDISKVVRSIVLYGEQIDSGSERGMQFHEWYSGVTRRLQKHIYDIRVFK